MSSSTLLPKARSNGKAKLVPPLRQFADADVQVVPLTVQQYHRMIKTGILPEGAPIELLDGLLVRKDRSRAGEDPMTVGTDHWWVTEELEELKPKFRRLNCYLRVQGPVTIPPRNEPEADGAIFRGKRSDYRGQHPGPKDMLCAIEVSDSSLRQDRTTNV